MGAPPVSVISPRIIQADAREGFMSNAGNALLWTVGLFGLSFAMIFVVWVADRMRRNFLGGP
jgi:hypothetical protein